MNLCQKIRGLQNVNENNLFKGGLNMKFFLIFIISIIVIIATAPVMGTTIIIQEPEVIVKNAPLIVEVVVKEIKFNSISHLSVGKALITLKVVDRIVGNCPSEILIGRFNVTPELKFLDTEWDPSFSIGEHFIICLLPAEDVYTRLGHYNSKFNIENNFIKGTQINVGDFKKQIKEVHLGIKNKFPDELPRQTLGKANNSLKKAGQNYKITSEINHLNGEFITDYFTWNTSYLPVQIHYNSSGAPPAAPDANSIANLTNLAYSIWQDQYSFLSFQNASPFTTTAGHTDDTYNVVYWFDNGNISPLGQTFPNPAASPGGDFYGPGTNTGVDIWFNSNANAIWSWYFNATPPSTRNLSQVDFVEVLAHELGHAMGLVDLENVYSLMNRGYLDSQLPIRGMSDGDKAGNVYQHTSGTINLSGTISHSMVLSALTSPRRIINITNNVSIPSGKTFELENGKVQVNLNSGTWVKSTGGYFIDWGDNIWNPDLKRVSGSTLLGHYSSLNTAIADASTGQSIDVLSGTFTLNNNILIPSGVTLTIRSGVTINLVNGANQYSIKSTGGTITRESGSTINGLKATLTYSSAIKGLFSSIQTAVDAAGTGSAGMPYYVVLPTGTFSENVSASNKTYVTIYGTNYTTLTGSYTFYNCNNLNLVMSTYNQVNMYYCNNCTLNCGISGSLSQTGLGLYYCSNFNQGGGEVYSFNTGLNASGSSGWSQLGDFTSNNTSISSSGGANVGVSYNSFCESNNYDFSVSSSGYIVSYNCQFRNGQQRSINSGGTIAGPYSPSSCPMAKKSVDTDEQENIHPVQIQNDYPVDDEFSKVNSSYLALLKKINEAKEKGIEDDGEIKNELLNIVKDYKNFINKNPESTLARVALTTAANSYWLLPQEDRVLEDNNNRESFLDEIINDKELASLKGFAENLMIDYYTKTKDINGAISSADVFINTYKNDEALICDGLLKKGLLLSYELKQSEKAAECFSTIIKNYPNNPLAEFAKNQLDILGEGSKETPGGNQLKETAGISTSAYPNPFNPTTTIKYTLPIESKVEIIIYDIMGREVRTLVNGYNGIGYKEVMWDGKNNDGQQVSSGIYVCRLKGNIINGLKCI
jgi:hypothetical protein